MAEKALLAAVVLAGRSSKEEDMLATYTLGRPKGLIPIAGRPMISYVVEALGGAQHVGPIVVVGLLPEESPPFSVPISHVPDHGDMLANAEAGICHALAQAPHLAGVLISSADLPLLTPAVVDDFIEECLLTEHDLYYGVVERSVMEGRFPASRRTYVRLTDGEFAGGDLILMRTGVMMANQELWRRLAQARKNPIRQAFMLGGLWPLAKLLTHRMSLAEAVQRVSRALQIRGRAVVCACPEVGMDVDKPFQLEIARTELEGRSLGPLS